ncbi:hypothetical protein MCHIJ_27310 [Mycolicibacterium chitae]|nr:hypothetical protein MCHIJ_27310 [Mycolicibacterium chitae]
MPNAGQARILEGMAAKEIDRNRANSALEVIKQHPGMVLFLASPALIVLAVVWFAASPGWAILLLITFVAAGGAAVLLKR